MNQLTFTTIRRLPELKANSTDIRQLELAAEYWQAMHAEAGSLKERAWREYNNAVDLQLPRAVIGDLLGKAILFDDICRDTWEEWEAAKQNLLTLHN